MERIFWIFHIFSHIFSVGAQFNGYNCDANFHSRFPGEKLEEKKPIHFYRNFQIT